MMFCNRHYGDYVTFSYRPFSKWCCGFKIHRGPPRDYRENDEDEGASQDFMVFIRGVDIGVHTILREKGSTPGSAKRRKKVASVKILIGSGVIPIHRQGARRMDTFKAGKSRVKIALLELNWALGKKRRE